nr:FAD-binding oxidoreductase [Candidatus Njordarchaeum guaymaensis]
MVATSGKRETRVPSTFVNGLAEIVGNEHVSADEEDLLVYSEDLTCEEACKPDVIVMPENVEQIQKIVRLANNEKVPITPFVAGANMGGLTLTERGIILDLKRMNRILEVNEKAMYAIIEPGVTFGQLEGALKESHPSLRFSYPNSPPYTSVLVNALLEGLGNLSLKYDATASLLNGLEVVLPTGELAKIGSCATSKYWFSRYPLPDIAGLFIGWQGTTGIATKGSIALLHRPKFRDLFSIGMFNADNFSNLAIRMARADIAEDIEPMSFDLVRAQIEKYPLKQYPGNFEMLFFVTISADTEKEFKLKQEILNEIIRSEQAKGMKGLMFAVDSDNKRTILDLPGNMIFKYIDHKQGGGCTWVGSYIPIFQWEEGYKRGKKIMIDHGFSPTIMMRAMNGSHYAVLRFILPFNKADPKDVDNVRKCMVELSKLVMELGGIVYKTPKRLGKLLWEKADPGFIELLKRVKRMLDPNGIMNPGKLCF